MVRPSLLCAVILITKTVCSQNYFRNLDSNYESQYIHVDDDMKYNTEEESSRNVEPSVEYEADPWRLGQERNRRMKYASTSNSYRSPLFPEKPIKNITFVPDIPPECQKVDLCGNVPNYPYDYIEHIINQIPDSRIFNIEAQKPENNLRVSRITLSNYDLCKSVMKIIYPEAARTAQGEWVFILNKKRQKLQGILTEKCLTPDKSCNHKAYVDGRHELICKQRFIEKTMWAIDYAGKVVKITTDVPSCCSCFITPGKNWRKWPFY